MSYWNREDASKDIIGKTVSSIIKGDDVLIFKMTDCSEYTMLHEQDCCESVTIDWNNTGDLNVLIGKKIVGFSESSEDGRARHSESSTDTTYRFETDTDSVRILWCGESNGYYSESPSFYRTKSGQVPPIVKKLCDVLNKSDFNISNAADKEFIDSISEEFEDLDIDEEFQTTIFGLTEYSGTSSIRAYVSVLRDKNKWSDETYNYVVGLFER
jgi:hypothetical protein